MNHTFCRILPFTYYVYAIYRFQIVTNSSIKESRPLSTASTSTAPKLLLNYCEPKDTKKPKHRKAATATALAAKQIRYLSGDLIHKVH